MGRGLRIIRHESSVQRVPDSGAVKFNPGAVQTGAADSQYAAAQSIARALGDISEVSMKIANAEIMADLSARTRQREEDFNSTVDSLLNEPDIKAHDGIVKDFSSRVDSLGRGLKGMAAKQWAVDMNQRAGYFDAHFKQITRQRRLENTQQNFALDRQSAIDAGNEFQLRRAYTAAAQGGLMTQELALKSLTNDMISIGARRIHNMLETQIGNGQKTLDQALEMLNFDNIEIAEADGSSRSYSIAPEVRQDIAKKLIFWKSQRDRQLQETQESTDAGFQLAYRKNKLTPEMIDAALQNRSITAQKAEHYYELLLKKGPAQSDPVTRANLNDKVMDVKNGILPLPTVRDEIDAQRRSGRLADDDYFSLRDGLKASYDSRIKESVSEAKQFGKSQILSQGLMGFSGEPVQYAKLNEFSKALDDWILSREKEGKPATAEEVYTQSRAMIPFYRMSPGKLAQEMAKDIEGQQAIEKQYQAAPQGLETVWNRLNLQEKKDAAELLRRGFTAQQIVEALNNGK